jgi:tryptophanyl-tRNA synthetase
MLEPIRQRRMEYKTKPEEVDEILKNGTERARMIAQETMAEVKKALKVDYFQS